MELIDKSKDITIGMQLNTPPLFISNENYDISNNGTMVTFQLILEIMMKHGVLLGILII